ncbi:hypothetical protein BDZ89DRAFT_1160531, partial [Hymenopellis radicata]
MSQVDLLSTATVSVSTSSVYSIELRLPPEMLQAIFVAAWDHFPAGICIASNCFHHSSFVYPLPIILMHICRRWRNVARKTRALWATITLCPTDTDGSADSLSLQYLDRVLQYAKDIPMDVYCYGMANSEAEYALCDKLFSYSNQWRRAQIRLEGRYRIDLLEQLREKLGLLENLLLWGNIDGDHDVHYSEDEDEDGVWAPPSSWDVFLSAPRLTQVTYYCRPCEFVFPWNKLLEFSVHLDGVDYWPALLNSIAQDSGSTGLKSLAITVKLLGLENEEPADPDDIVPHVLRSVQRLRLENCDLDNLPTLRAATFPSLTQLFLCEPSPECIEAAISLIERSYCASTLTCVSLHKIREMDTHMASALQKLLVSVPNLQELGLYARVAGNAMANTFIRSFLTIINDNRHATCNLRCLVPHAVSVWESDSKFSFEDETLSRLVTLFSGFAALSELTGGQSTPGEVRLVDSGVFRTQTPELDELRICNKGLLSVNLKIF